VVIEEVLIVGTSEYLLELGAIAVSLGTLAAIPALVIAIRTVFSQRPSVPALATGFALHRESRGAALRDMGCAVVGWMIKAAPPS
jgi:hypothetical protein